MCGDCLQLVAALQLELGTNAAFAQALVTRAGWACEGMAPHLVEQVTVLMSCWAPSSAPISLRHGSILHHHLLLSSAAAGWGGGT